MARRYTGKEVHEVVDEGRTGRVIGRRILRRGLGNPKTRVKELQVFAMEMYTKGFVAGGEYLRGRIQNSVAALDYGGSYYVPPVIEEAHEEPAGSSIDLMSDGPLAHNSVVSSNTEADGVDAHGGTDFPEPGSLGFGAPANI